MKGCFNNLIFPAGLAFLMSFTFSVNGQDLSKGRIIDTIVCLNHPDQKYSLFLPPAYTEKVQWPVIAIFDPGGNGKEAVGIFRKSAEKYGYILACSYNSRNGPLNNNFIAAASVISDLEQRFNLDEKRIYAAGFSGGSRFALALATSNKIFSGVIGCGAGIPNDKNLYPSGKSSFIYYGIAGNKDMNYLEMFDLMTFFNTNTQVTPYLRTFDGGHQWPSPEIIQEAVEWINLQAMRKKIVVVDSAYITFCYNKIMTLVNKLTADGNYFDPARYLRYAIRDFSGGQNARNMVKLLSSFEESKVFREENREWSGIASQERSRTEKYVKLIGEVFYSGSVPDTAALWWKGEIGSLSMLKVKGNPQKRFMASRLLNFISILCSEQGSASYQQKRYNLAKFFFEICTWSDSENMYNYYNLARSLSGSNDKREAIEALNKAIDHGFVSGKTVRLEPVFDPLRNEKNFKLLLLKMK